MAAEIDAEASRTVAVVPGSETPTGEGDLIADESIAVLIRTGILWYHRIMVKYKARVAQLMLDRSARTANSGWIQYEDTYQANEAALYGCILDALLR